MNRKTQTIERAKMYSRLVAGLLLLKRRAGPLVAEALGQDLGGDLAPSRRWPGPSCSPGRARR